jgi:hypothetical protein
MAKHLTFKCRASDTCIELGASYFYAQRANNFQSPFTLRVAA